MSYSLQYTGAQVDAILGRAASGGAIDSAIAAKQSPATTLAGYGITDARISGNDITLGSNTISVLTSQVYNYPVESTPAWNRETRAGSVTPSLTLPAPTGTVAEELRYIFTAASANATFTAPAGYILADIEDGFAGLSAGNTLALSALTTGSIYECSFAVIDGSHIGLIMKEWKTA